MFRLDEARLRRRVLLRRLCLRRGFLGVSVAGYGDGFVGDALQRYNLDRSCRARIHIAPWRFADQVLLFKSLNALLE